MAKLAATEGAQQVIDAAVQMFGGLGVVSGEPVERLYREIRALRIYEGATEVQQLIIARELLKDTAQMERMTMNEVLLPAAGRAPRAMPTASPPAAAGVRRRHDRLGRAGRVPDRRLRRRRRARRWTTSSPCCARPAASPSTSCA